MNKRQWFLLILISLLGLALWLYSSSSPATLPELSRVTPLVEVNIPAHGNGQDKATHQSEQSLKEPGTVSQDRSLPSESMFLPDERNGYLKLIAATKIIYWPEELKNLLASGAVSLDASEEIFDLLRRVLADNGKALGLLREALALGKGQVPRLDSFDAEIPELIPLLYLGHLLGFEGLIAAREGRPEGALDAALAQQEFGQLILGSGGYLIHVLVGQAIGAQGNDLRNEIVNSGRIPIEDYEMYLPKLFNTENMIIGLTTALSTSLMTERATVIKTLDEIQRPNPESLARLIGMEEIPKEIHRLLEDPSPTRPRFDRDETMKLYDQLIRLTDKAVQASSYLDGKIFLDHAQTVLAGIPNLYSEDQDSAMAHFVKEPNPFGKLLVNALMPSFAEIVNTSFRQRMELLSSEFRVACGIYRNLYGELPRTLEELHPYFLQTPPIDPWDGCPVRYLRDRRLIYFVGEDLTDNGGDGEKDSVFSLD